MYAAVVLIRSGANTRLTNNYNKTCFCYMMEEDKKKLLMDLAESVSSQGQGLGQSRGTGAAGTGSASGAGAGSTGGANNGGGIQARPPLNSPPR